MKAFVRQLRRGDTVDVIVREQLRGGDLIITYNGDLLRVTNATLRTFAAGQTVNLVVASTEPLSFRLNEKKDRSFRPGQFNKIV